MANASANENFIQTLFNVPVFNNVCFPKFIHKVAMMNFSYLKA